MEHSRSWEQVVCAVDEENSGPSPRSLHDGAVVEDDFYIFGGFDGVSSTCDLFRFNFSSRRWFQIQSTSNGAPQARDRHTLVCYKQWLYLFGGFVNNGRSNEFYRFDTKAETWTTLSAQGNKGITTLGLTPSPRHSHAMSVGMDSLWLFGGFDGLYKNDLHEFNLKTNTWSRIMAKGDVPKPRYRTSMCFDSDCLYVYAGHDGQGHMNDVCIFNINDATWTKLQCDHMPNGPSPRDSHIAVTYDGSMYIFGGSSLGCANNDFQEFCLAQRSWSPVVHNGLIPRSRFCHVGVVQDSSLYVFGGYDGSRRLQDFQMFRFGYGTRKYRIPESTLVSDLHKYVASDIACDIEFVVQGQTIAAHGILCSRCPYFNRLLMSTPVPESEQPKDMVYFRVSTSSSPFVIENIKVSVFMVLLEYLYTDTCNIGIGVEPHYLTMEDLISLYRMAREYDVTRLSLLCLREISDSINIENVAVTLKIADANGLSNLRELCLAYVTENFNLVSTSKGFETMGRENVDLLFEVLRERLKSNEVDDSVNSLCTLRRWKIIGSTDGSELSARSLHAAVVYKDAMYVFGGYDGKRRVNDFYRFGFVEKRWSRVEGTGDLPLPRDRHTLTLVDDVAFLFGGFYDSFILNEMYKFDLERNEWQAITSTADGPTPRHSHSCVAQGQKLWVFGGYDGMYLNDLHMFNTVTEKWSLVEASGRPPEERYRTTCVVHNNNMIVFGGHNGVKHLNDLHILSLDRCAWSQVQLQPGLLPPVRDSHISVVKGNTMYVFGGASGTPLSDFWGLDLKSFEWTQVQTEGMVPSPRFCHVGCVYNSSLYVFGGYNGCKRLQEFNYIELNRGLQVERIPSSSLSVDLEGFVNNQQFSDVKFLVQDIPVYAHKLMCLRCQYFEAMFVRCKMKESTQTEVVINEVDIDVFVELLRYLYTDSFKGDPLQLFNLADRFGVLRLKLICESKLFQSITQDNCCDIFHLAHVHSSQKLKEKALHFIIENFDTVSKSEGFAQLARRDVELILDVLKVR